MTDYTELGELIAAAAAAERTYSLHLAVLKRAQSAVEQSHDAAREAWQAAEAWTRDRISEAAGHLPD